MAESLTKPTPAALKALGRRPLPEQIEVEGSSYRRRRVFKNDFFAVTSLFEGPTGRVILKVQRQASFLLVPLGWIGRLLAARETAALERLQDLDGIPRMIGRWGKTGVVREYIEGHPLARKEPVADDFHNRLRALIGKVHERRMAYVDLEKCENVLVGDDGRPYLIDFQIAWYVSPKRGGELWPLRRLRRWLQAGDLYHLTKLQRRTRPDQLSTEQLAASYRKPWFMRLHRFITAPLTWGRRRILDRIDPRRAPGERGRIAEDECVGDVKQCQ
jgi:hypothetical protein